MIYQNVSIYQVNILTCYQHILPEVLVKIRKYTICKCLKSRPEARAVHYRPFIHLRVK